MIDIKEIFFNVEAKDFKEMIDIIGNELFKKNYINEGFKENIIKRENKYPTGLHFDGIDVAIPHTDPEYVKKSGVIAISLKQPIEITHMATTDQKLMVKNFFMLLVDEGKLQMDLLTEMMESFNNKEIQDRLKSLKNKNDLENIFK